MEWYWWLVIAVIGALVLWQVFKAAVGHGIDITQAGRLYLLSELKKAGISQIFPNEMIFEIADRYSGTAVAMAKMSGKSQMSAKTEMIGYLDSQVWQILAWLRGSDDLVQKQRSLVEVMERYGMHYGCLKGKL